MANLTFHQPYDLLDPDAGFEDSIKFSPVQVDISDGNRTTSYFGSFAMSNLSDPDSITGTITGFDLRDGGVLKVSMRGLDVDVETLDNESQTEADDLVYFLRGADSLFGSSGDDKLMGFGGNDQIDGGAGQDTAFFTAALANYTITRNGGATVVSDRSGGDGTDTLTNVEKLQFSDKSINLTVDELAGHISASNLKLLEELYVAFFNRVPDADGLGYWIGQLRGGMTINQIADLFYAAGVQYSALTGYSASMSNADFVNVVYRNVLGRSEGADAEGLAYWSARLDSGAESKGALVQSILGSAHTFKGNATWGWVADLLDNKAYVAHEFAVDMGLNYLNPQESISRGMQIAAAVTPTDTDAAIALIGINPANIDI